MIDSEVTLLPQPDSPTRPRISPRRTVEVDAGHGAHCALAQPERGPQALDVEQHLALRPARPGSCFRNELLDYAFVERGDCHRSGASWASATDSLVIG